MYTIESRNHDVKVAICDRCGKEMSEDAPYDGYGNRTQIRFRAGYASLFGDGNKVEGDLCDKCLYDVLGRYLRIVEPSPDEAKAYNSDPGTPLESFFEMQARRVYAPYQTPYQMVENVALILREWCMTMPDERTKALLWAGGFLVELARDETLTLAVRQRAVEIARHFPTVQDVSQMALFHDPSGLDIGLTSPRETDGWKDRCRFGPLTYFTRLARPEPPPTRLSSTRNGHGGANDGCRETRVDGARRIQAPTGTEAPEAGRKRGLAEGEWIHVTNVAALRHYHLFGRRDDTRPRFTFTRRAVDRHRRRATSVSAYGRRGIQSVGKH